MIEKRASIDIGSNSILLLAVELGEESFKTLLNESHVTGLGKDLDINKQFIQTAMDESYAVLKNYQDQCVKLGIQPDQIIATATEASRVASNAKEFFTKVKNELGIHVQTISGEGEAYYSTKGILFDKGIKEHTITIMDIGGASTELIQVNTATSEILHSFSMPVGAVRINNWIKANICQQELATVFADYHDRLELIRSDKLYCVAGTMTSVGNMYLENKDFIESEVNGLEILVTEINNMVGEYGGYSAAKLQERFPFLGKRAYTIQSGLTLAMSIFERLAVEQVYISTYGLRYGTILEGKIKDIYAWK